MTEMLEAARRLRARGLSVIPIGPDKRPLVEWKVYQEAPAHPDEIDEWFTRWPSANVGVVTGRVSSLVVLDADGPDGLASLKALGTTARTWLQRTGRLEGGWQQAFRHPGNGVTIGNRAGLRPGLDVRGDGGYVVVPPSLHPSGRRYEWLTSPDDVELADLPPPLLELLLTPATGHGQPATTAEIPQGQRNDTLYRLGRSLVSKGLSRGAITAALLEENRARCRPPLSEREVRAVAAHAAEQPHRPDFGAAAEAAVHDRRPLAVGLADFFAAQKDAPDPPPLIEGILSADGSGWIAGEEKLGKTPYALEEAVCLALAAPVCGRFKVPTRQRVLFFCEEDTARRAYKRLRPIIRGKGLDPDDPRLELNAWFRLAVWSGIKLDDPVLLARVDAEHEAFRPVVTYYDSLRKIQRSDLNKTYQAEAFLDALDGLRRKYGTLARVVAHNRKVAAGGFRTGRGSQEIAGSHVLGAWGECSLFFEPIGRKAGAVRVTVQVKDWAPMDPFRLVIESTGASHTPETMTLRAEDDQGEDADERVLTAIATLPPVTPVTGSPGVPKAAIAALLKCSERTVQRSLSKLEGSGRISVTGQLSKARPLYVVSGQ